MSSTTCTSLSLATAAAVAFLTRSLHLAYNTQTVEATRAALTTTLTAHYAASWNAARPTDGARRRILTLAPGAAPPRPVHAAATAACVSWPRWIATLGGAEFDLLVSPGAVRVRAAGTETLVWTDVQASEDALVADIRAALREKMRAGTRTRTLPALALDTAVVPAPRAPSPASSVSSGRDSLFSAVSAASSASSAFSPLAPKAVLPAVKPAPAAPYKMSRRERARQTRNNIVTLPPAAPTAYDGGKTTVLGGGIRLGPARAIACA